MSITEFNATVPENLERLIRERGLRQIEVAHRAGFSPQQFCDMLNGRKIIKPCDIVAISNAIGVRVEELFVDTNQAST